MEVGASTFCTLWYGRRPWFKTKVLMPIHADFTAKKYMEILTGWSLLFVEEVSLIVLKGSSRFSTATRLERAQVMLWTKKAELGLLAQLCEGHTDPWLSISCEC
jgi:hypothetical protein